MNGARSVLAFVVVLGGASAFADPPVQTVDGAPTAEAPSWEFAISAYPTVVRGGENYTSEVATADRGPLHLEARHNYESIGSGSAFVGWNLSGKEPVTWELTPLLGGAWGTTQAFVPGLEASLSAGAFDVYIEAEYVRDSHAQTDSYVYAWTELGYRPADFLRVGVAGQHTRIYGGDRAIQRGPFAQVTVDRVTVGGYWFNPGASDQVFVGLVSIAF